MRDSFDPTLEQQNVILVDAAALRESEKRIESCKHCHPDNADIPFDWILDRVTGSDPSVTDYILREPAKCPNCRREILCPRQAISKSMTHDEASSFPSVFKEGWLRL